MNIPIDIKYLHTWVNRDYFFRLIPKAKLVEENIDILFEVPKENYYAHKTYNGRLYEDAIELSSGTYDDKHSNVNYHFPKFHYAEIGYYEDDNIALGLGYDNNSTRDQRKDYSLLQKFFDEKIIDHYSFSITKSDNGERYFHFGGIPSEYTNDLGHQKCKVQGKNRAFWDCLFNIIYYGNDSFNVDKYVSFDNRNDYIFAPKLFIDYLSTTYFKEGIIEKQCIYTSRIFCKEDYLRFLPNFTFIIDHNTFHISPRDLFKYNPENKRSLMFMVKDNYENTWVLGQPFIKKYNVLFDYDNHKIDFYSKDLQVINDNKQDLLYLKTPQKILLSFNVLFMIIGIGIIAYFYYNKIKVNIY